MSATTERARVAAVVLTAVAIVVLVSVFAVTARAEGVTKEQLLAHGWTCVPFPLPPATPTRYSCFNPGLGRPFPGNPDPRPEYTFVAFDAVSGDFIYTGHLIRGDLYNGQPCAPGGDPYVYRMLIGYYECVHT
jgi:hypothetical protein